MPQAPGTIAWSEWGAEAFARAVRDDMPILLALVAPWCEHCAVMDRTTYARDEVAARVNASFVAVRVDTERRPDINERYNLGGWPTTAFLTPRGDILGGGTFIGADAMPGALDRVLETFRQRRPEIERRAASLAAEPSPRSVDQRPDDDLDWLCARLVERFDAAWGGFGDGPKFPHVPALTLLLECYRDTGDPTLAGVVTRSLEGIGRLFDEVEGGFFRYASGREWSAPHTEKILFDNAELIRLHLDAGIVLERPAYLERAARAIRWTHEVLADRRNGGFGASRAADRSYYAAGSSEGRAGLAPPCVDVSQYTDANAAMVVAYLRAAQVLGDGEALDLARRSLDRAMSAYQPGAGIAHAIGPEPDVWGLLGDHVRTAEALLQAHVVTGQLPYSMLAAELVEYMLKTMWDDADGGFHDRAADRPAEAYGLLTRPLRPFVLNCDAARMLFRLSIVTGRSVYRNRALQTLDGLGHAYRDDPIAGAPYGLAVREVREGLLPPGVSLSYVDWRLGEPHDR